MTPFISRTWAPSCVVELLVAALRGEVEVELAEGRQERVRVVELDDGAAGVGHLEPVAERQLRLADRALEEAGRMETLELHRLAVLGEDAHRLRRRPERAHDDLAAVRVGAEEVVRVAWSRPTIRSTSWLATFMQLPPRAAARCRRRGCRTQSGRWASS